MVCRYKGHGAGRSCGTVILRFSKIRQCVICHPEPLLCFRRMELEMLQLECSNRIELCVYENGAWGYSDYMLLEILRRVN
ncbi:hypothetical protein DPMN_192615 [Dreissena polymorpha]|uniref:Uncharacterized protein n=1 Tax=Dreissena polymorpha TaxID=45954 RepID=A0A9D4BH03_DREPO|nr:hypothetical protein DPMN_192615 [Dreissena polymorpha]